MSDRCSICERDRVHIEEKMEQSAVIVGFNSLQDFDIIVQSPCDPRDGFD